MSNRKEKRFDLIVFDWDGTLMDSTPTIAGALQHAFADLGLPVPELAAANHVIGLGLAEALQYLTPGISKEKEEQLLARYRYHFLESDHSLRLFEGVEPMLKDLCEQGYLLAVATGKARRGLNRALEQTGLQKMFNATRCADESFSKPHPEMLLYLVETLSTEPDRTIMVGDTTHDIQMAHNAKAHAIAVSYGAHPQAELHAVAPLAIVDSVQQLHQKLVAW